MGKMVDILFECFKRGEFTQDGALARLHKMRDHLKNYEIEAHNLECMLVAWEKNNNE